MSATYKVSSIIFSGPITSCPPPYLSSLFPTFDGSQKCETMETDDGPCVLVTFDSPQTPADLGPLVKVELVPDNPQG